MCAKMLPFFQDIHAMRIHTNTRYAGCKGEQERKINLGGIPNSKGGRKSVRAASESPEPTP